MLGSQIRMETRNEEGGSNGDLEGGRIQPGWGTRKGRGGRYNKNGGRGRR